MKNIPICNKILMKIEVNRDDLIALVRGCGGVHYSQMEHPLVIKSGHEYIDCYGKTNWYTIKELTDDELYRLYLICKNSWK